MSSDIGIKLCLRGPFQNGQTYSNKGFMMSRMLITRRGALAGSLALASGQRARAEGRSNQSIDAVWQGIELSDATGATFQIRDCRATLTLVKLWANWCPACLTEMQTLKSLVAAIGPRDIEVILVSHPEYWSHDQLVARNRGFAFRLATLALNTAQPTIQAALTEPNGAYAVPRSLLFKKGKETAVWVHRDAREWNSPEVITQLKSQIG